LANTIIVTEHLSHTYFSGALEKKALIDINLRIERDSCVAIIGINGSGKSTLAQHINGLLRPTAGRILVDGIDVGARNADLRALRQRVGMLFQFPEAQLFERTIFDDVAFGPRRMHLSRPEIRARTFAALDTVGLEHGDYAARSPFDLSGGQRRRVALAGVLAMSPTVLVLDEPSVGLDGEGRRDFYRSLAHVRQERGITTVLISHDMSEVVSMANWLYVLHQGHLVMQGPPRALFLHGKQLREYGLAVPPLSELFNSLREQGLAVPEDLLTLDEAVAFFTAEHP
jgi:energy-coupling factor transport system ATP-binding protein